MSAPKFTLRLTEPAQLDFEDILLFTLKHWGEDQVAEYRRRIDKALSALADNPNLGRKKHDLMVYQVERHQIFYYTDEDAVCVIRILHERMDAARYLDDYEN